MGVPFSPIFMVISSPFRESKVRGRALSGLGLYPHPAAVAFRDLLAHRQADSGAGKLFSAVQPLKHNENLLEVLRVDAKSVVSHGKDPFVAAIFIGRDLDARGLRTSILAIIAVDS